MERVSGEFKMAYIGNAQLSLGFKMSGITESYVAKETEEIEPRLKELLARHDIGIIVITSSVRKQVRDRKLGEAISTGILPLIVEVPEQGESFTEEDTLRIMIRRALGIDIMQAKN